jgi:GAF domain-containing protein
MDSDQNLGDRSLRGVFDRLSKNLERDRLVQQTTTDLRNSLQVDRVVLYYFYEKWQGRVTFEALSDQKYSIFGSTGPDACFNQEYAALYLAGRVRAIADIESEAIADCHRNFLRELNVRANLVVPILNSKGLWGLLVAHNCQDIYAWSETNIAEMRQGAESLAMSSAIQDT